ncbi:MAG: TonB-dependent receptor [Rhodocyclaceae bacterium]|jgi:iron complex outermembrane receptor protein|nr:TonB-dependent receptor [Rhodocyclaceae bacterium]
MNKIEGGFVLRVLPILIASVYAGGAFAQEKIEEVIVTAQKRKEKLQEVPISISAISGGQLEVRGIDGAKDLNALAPNVTVVNTGGSSLIAATSIRGMNSGQPAIWADPSVGIYVDGIFVGKNQGALFDVIDMERVEVLRGPQGTLFGRNTEGGAINMISRKPSGEFSGNVGFEIGNYSRQVAKVSMDLPRMGMLRASFALRDEKRNGTVGNDNGGAWNDRDRQSGRVALGLDVSPSFKIDYAYDKTNIDEKPLATSLYASTGYGALYTSPAVATTYGYFQNGVPTATGRLPSLASRIAPYASKSHPSTVTSDPGRSYFNTLDIDGHALTATYEINASNTLKYIGAKRKMRYRDSTDLDGTPISLFNAGKDTHYETTSHEVQWIGNTASMNYVLGAYLFEEDGNTYTFQNGALYTFVPGVVAYRQPWYRVQTDAKAIYGQVDYKLTAALTATLGMRYTREEKRGNLWRINTNASYAMPASASVVCSATVTAPCYQAGFTPTGDKETFSASTPVVALAYKVNDTLNVYGRVARGFKSGGFPLEAQTVSAAMKPYGPEKSTSYEAGFKSTLLGGKANVNVAVFRTDVDDWHVSQLPVGGTQPVIVNAGKARTQGLEIEAAFQIADGWRAQLSYGYLESEFKRFMQFTQTGVLVDASSNSEIGYAPKNQLAVNLDGRLAKTRWGTLRGIVDYVYTDEFYNYAGQKSATAANAAVGNSAAESKMPSTGFVNGRLLLSGIPVGGPGMADVSLWVRNATNVKRQSSHIDVGGYYRIATWTEPRTYGLSVNYKW